MPRSTTIPPLHPIHTALASLQTASGPSVHEYSQEDLVLFKADRSGTAYSFHSQTN